MHKASHCMAACISAIGLSAPSKAKRLTELICICSKSNPSAQQEKQSGRRLTPAGRIICFAQLRAEIMENHAQEAWKSSEIMKILIFRIPQNFNISKCFEYFCLWLTRLRLFLKSSNDDLTRRNLQHMNKSQNWSRIHAKHSRCNVKCWNLGFCPTGPSK